MDQASGDRPRRREGPRPSRPSIPTQQAGEAMSDTQSYTDEFKREVVQRANSGAISVNDLARELDISASTIYRWRRTMTDEEAPPPAPEEPADSDVQAAVASKKEKKSKMSKKDKKGDKKDRKKDKKRKKGKGAKKDKKGKKKK